MTLKKEILCQINLKANTLTVAEEESKVLKRGKPPLKREKNN